MACEVSTVESSGKHVPADMCDLGAAYIMRMEEQAVTAFFLIYLTCDPRQEQAIVFIAFPDLFSTQLLSTRLRATRRSCTLMARVG